MNSLNWKTEKKNIIDLKPYEYNPRTLTQKGLEDLKKSIGKFGLAEPLVINTTGLIIGGHARYEVLKVEGVTEVDCYVPERELTEQECKELNVRLNKNIAGEWDFDILANAFDDNDLLEWGFQEWELGLNEANDEIDPNKELEGAIDFQQDGLDFYKGIIVRFLTEKDYKDFCGLIGQKLTDKTKSIWFPKQYFDSNNNGKVYVER